jgi:type I site-specific restriction endonuclease
VLFAGLRPVATIEAKRFGNDVMDDLRQAEEYSRDIQLAFLEAAGIADGQPLYLRTWPLNEDGSQSFKLPFAFSTNGREFQHQIASKSGIWFRDLRDRRDKSRPLMGWPMPEELLGMLEDQRRDPELLEEESMDYLRLYPYQQRAIKAVEAALLNDQRQVLIAMATGTGKTRITIGLMYRLLKAGLFKRILFLVDRNTLGHPTFTYSYREAVIDGYLVDYEPPYTLMTRLNQEGIHFDAGDKVEVMDKVGEVRTEDLPDELDFEVDDFNRRVLNDNFNAVVCDELAKNYLDPTGRRRR